MAVRPRPTGLMRLFFKVPPLLCRLGLGGPAAGTVLLLVTRGRRSGRRRYTGLNYARDGDTVYVMSGFGERTDWVRNLVADPRVDVQIGRRRWHALATIVKDPERRARGIDLLLDTAQRQGPPKAIRPLLRRIGFDYDGEVATMDREAPGMPIVALTPSQRA